MYKIGSNGDVVKQIQLKLGITSDGNFGPGTEKSVKEWQAKHGLTPDGIVGPTTLEKMGITSVIKEDIHISPVVGLSIEKLISSKIG